MKFCTYNHSVLILRTCPLLGNSGGTSDQKGGFLAVDSGVDEIGENSKTVYINDNYNLDTIPLDVDTIIDTDDSDNTE